MQTIWWVYRCICRVFDTNFPQIIFMVLALWSILIIVKEHSLDHEYYYPSDRLFRWQDSDLDDFFRKWPIKSVIKLFCTEFACRKCLKKQMMTNSTIFIDAFKDRRDVKDFCIIAEKKAVNCRRSNRLI